MNHDMEETLMNYHMEEKDELSYNVITKMNYHYMDEELFHVIIHLSQVNVCAWPRPEQPNSVVRSRARVCW